MSPPLRFAFAGTPAFAAWVLNDLREAGRRPELVISQPDRPRGRGRQVQPSPAVAAADKAGVPWLTTSNINEESVLDALRSANADVLVVAAFGQLLKPVLLDSLQCINVHGSLLPAYRGAAPIMRALRADEVETGVCIMRMLPGLDDGPWALRTRVSISPWDDAGSLGRKLALLGALGVDQVLGGLADGSVTWTEQVGEPTYAGKVTAEDRTLDVRGSARLAHAQVRALSPYIGCDTQAADVRFKVWRSWPYSRESLAGVAPTASAVAGSPGALALLDGRMFVGCGEGVLEVLRVQPAGKSAMETDAFLRGYAARLGDRLKD
jgi:methionyl-tRNA formyltransferase